MYAVGGQGISSGFRDASGLAWRLAVLIRENANQHEKLLSGWFCEGQQQLHESLAKTIQNGKRRTESNSWRFIVLKLVFKFMQNFPPLNRVLESGLVQKA
jgi:2-polyprenyl-6-methoxyphenol hydroxylase-like FAD-dependent oxidoreductase